MNNPAFWFALLLLSACATSDRIPWSLSDCSDPANAFHCERSSAWWVR